MRLVSRAAAVAAASVVAVACTVAVVPLRAQTPEQTLARATAALSKVKTLRASFTQTVNNPLLRRNVQARGEMVQRLPGQMSVRFTDPAGDRIVADGRWIWLYLPSTAPGQVIKMPSGTGAGGVPDITSQFLDSPRERYTISSGGAANVGGRPAHVLVLVPRREGLPFERATVWVDDADGLIRQFETVDASGLTRRVTITKLEVNPTVRSSEFTFTPPRGVRVVNQAGM
ncbi:MAG: outer membrane lipoprotein chaperone LolA [Gemmatimonadaceae bacterium]